VSPISWGSPISYATGNIVTASAWNTNSGNLVILENQVGLFDVGQTIEGGIPATNAPNSLIEAGQNAVTTSGSGQFTYTFPTTFPNGLTTVLAQPGQASMSNPSAVIVLYDSGSDTCNVSQLGGVATSGGSAYATATLVLNWIAVGS
jgi:hypothetical protein